jgi:hypothetical protein
LKSELDKEELVKRFLLGDLSESERAELEDRFLASDEFFQELLIGEDDLIDAYVRGELSETERALFERNYSITQQGRWRVEFAGTLYTSTSGKPETVGTAREQNKAASWRRSLFGMFAARRPTLAFMLAAALAVVVFGGMWFLIERMRHRRPVPQQAQSEQTAATGQSQESTPPLTATGQEPSPQEKETPMPAASQATPKRAVAATATFTLLPGMVRGEGGSQINLPAGTAEVRLRLGMEDAAYNKYRATLYTPEGKQLWSRVVATQPSIKSAYITVSFPAALLKGGDYVMAVSGADVDGKWESVADYSFRVVKK